MSLTDKATALITAVRSFGTAVDAKTDNLGMDKQPLIANGLATDFYAGTQTWVDFASTARATPMTGVSLADDAAIVAEDSLLTAMGKAQAQLNKLLTSGITPGTYGLVTVDESGRAVAGSNPTTLAGYGITDAISTSTRGVANGVAALDAAGLVPVSQLPSYVDDVLEYANYATLPATGEAGKIYVTLDTNKTYRWSGSTYIFITSGAVDSVAGKTGVVTLVKGDVGLSNVDNTSDANKPVSSAQQTALNLKANLASPALTGTPTAPTATPGTNTTQLSTTEFVTAAVSLKANAAHTHAISDVSGLQTALDGKQALDADLTAIAALAGTTGLLRKTAANAWTLDTAAYLTANQNVAFTGDATGSGTTAVTLTLASSGIAAGTYNNSATQNIPITFDAKGRATATGEGVTITPDWTSITGKPTTVAELGISDIVSSGNATFYGPITESVGAINGNAALITPSNGTMQTWNLMQSATADFNLMAGQYVTLVVQNTASHSITWSNVAWVDNYPPELATSAKTVLAFWNIDGSVMGAKVGEIA